MPSEQSAYIWEGGAIEAVGVEQGEGPDVIAYLHFTDWDNSGGGYLKRAVAQGLVDWLTARLKETCS